MRIEERETHEGSTEKRGRGWRKVWRERDGKEGGMLLSEREKGEKRVGREMKSRRKRKRKGKTRERERVTERKREQNKEKRKR